MKKHHPALPVQIIILLFLTNTVFSQNVDELKINPLQFISLKEMRNITNTLGNEFYSECDFAKIPVLFYRPNVQELLFNYPHKPNGFSMYKGFSPFTDEIIYVRNDTTIFKIDDQNTSTEIEGIPVLVVADYFSRMRNQMSDIIRNRDSDFIYDWLEKWNFIPSPYDEIKLILHEAFHVFQNKKAPNKYANETIVSAYPLLDPINNALYVLEGNILRDALLTESSTIKEEKIKEFVAVRTYRQSFLKREVTEYENLNEYVEGTAKYIEYKFLKIGEKVQPVKEMFYQNGFNGYKGILSRQFKEEIENMVKIVSVSDNRFGNKFGTGPMRFRLYGLGACQALLLDEVMPAWKTKIFEDSVYLCDLLKNSAKLNEQEMKKYLGKAKADYNYDQIYQDKRKFEQDGKSKIQEKLNAILNSKNTLVTISYSKYPKIGMSYTPFGVTQINEETAIYDMVPIEVHFDKNTILKLKKVTPVYIDKNKKEITFAVITPISNLESYSGGVLDINEFTLSNVKAEIKKEGNHIIIQLK
jgi:hypothetical protein